MCSTPISFPILHLTSSLPATPPPPSTLLIQSNSFGSACFDHQVKILISLKLLKHSLPPSPSPTSSSSSSQLLLSLPTIHLSISQIGPQTTEKQPFLLSRSAPGGRFGYHIVARYLWPTPIIHPRISQISHKQLRKSTFYTLAAPPGGRSVRHLVAR